MSTFLVECDMATWQRYGFADKTDDESKEICQRVFASTLDGHPLVSNKSVWRNFPWVWNERWWSGNKVLIGDALHSAHFSIGSGTRLAIEDAIALVKALEAEPNIPAALHRYQTGRQPIVKKLVTAARTSADWYEKFPEHMRLDLMDFAYSYITRSGRIDDARLRAMSPMFMARYEASRTSPAARREQGMTSPRTGTHEIVDRVPPDSPGALEIGFAVPQQYNASRILFDNLSKGRASSLALTGPAGTRSYGELCAEACRWGHGLQSLGLNRGDRVLMFLDDTPVYPAAFFGAVRAGLVPLLINTLTPSDLLQFYLSDSSASVAVADAEFCSRFDAQACEDTLLRTLISVNGAAGDHAAPNLIAAETWLPEFSSDLAEADTHRNEMAFWMYSSGSTGRPKGIVHLQHDMAYSEAAFARHCSEAQAGRHLLFGAEDFLRLRLRQLDHLPVFRGRLDPAAAGPAQAGGDFRSDRAFSSHGVFRIADALHIADQGRWRRGHGFLLAANGAIRRRGALGGCLSWLEKPHRA